jgi:hypothetical protein
MNVLPKKLLLLATLLMSFPLSTSAQMFSMGADDDEDNQGPSNEGYSQFTISFSPTSLNYVGNTELEANRFRPLNFDASVLHVGYETLFTTVQIGYGGNITGLQNNTDFLTIHVKNLRPLLNFGTRNSYLFIPVGLNIDYTRIGDTASLGLGNNLNQSGFMVGSGVRYMRETERLLFMIGFDGFYGLSFADGSAFRGVTGHLNAPLRFMVKNVFGTVDLSLGYTFNFKNIDITNDNFERFDYELTHHQLSLGFRF